MSEETYSSRRGTFASGGDSVREDVPFGRACPSGAQALRADIRLGRHSRREDDSVPGGHALRAEDVPSDAGRHFPEEDVPFRDEDRAIRANMPVLRAACADAAGQSPGYHRLVPPWDAIVVGLGAMGSSALYQLSRRGLRVLGLEAFEPGHRLGSSHGESRVIRLAYHEHPSYVPLLQRAYELWSELEAESEQDLMTITGGLMIGPPSSELVSGARASAELHRLAYEVLTPHEVRRTYPVFHLNEDEIALWEPRSGVLRPERCIETFVSLARRHGAEVRYTQPVGGWRSDGAGIEVRSANGTYRAEHVVFACGARMSKVMGRAIPEVRAERCPLFWLEPTGPVGSMPIYLWETADRYVFYGFPHVDWPGVKVAMHHSGDFVDPDAVDRTVNAADEARLRGAIASRLPELNGAVLDSLVCLYENSPDGHFVIDVMADAPNVIYAAGFSGHGFKFASVVGEILADLVTRGEATPDADFLRARRLQEA